jgi:SAM-dependent methyltransferase
MSDGPGGTADRPLTGAAYDERFARLAESGRYLHGEADLVEWLVSTRLGTATVARVLDAGCGTGRIAVELDRRGLTVVGADRDPAMLEQARAKAPDLDWRACDLAGAEAAALLGPGGFDLVVLAGNVVLFADPGTEAVLISNVATAARVGGLVVFGFSLRPGGWSLESHDRAAGDAGLFLVERWSTWERSPFEAARDDYAVSVHIRR